MIFLNPRILTLAFHCELQLGTSKLHFTAFGDVFPLIVRCAASIIGNMLIENSAFSTNCNCCTACKFIGLNGISLLYLRSI